MSYTSATWNQVSDDKLEAIENVIEETDPVDCESKVYDIASMREVILNMPQSRSRSNLRIVYESEDEDEFASSSHKLTENAKKSEHQSEESCKNAELDEYKNLKAEVIGLL